MQIGDLVLFVPYSPLPVPRGKLRMWDVGKIICLHLGVVEVVDLCGVRHAVYERQVKLLQRGKIWV